MYRSILLSFNNLEPGKVGAHDNDLLAGGVLAEGDVAARVQSVPLVHDLFPGNGTAGSVS